MHSCLIVGGAPTEHKGLDHVLETCTFNAVFAVDAGYKAITERSIVPQHVCGDFDSLGYVPEEEIRLINESVSADEAVHLEVFDTQKDFTDMDWALNHATEEGFTNIVMCDALHDRLDHTLGNLQLMANAAHNGQRVWGVTENEVIITLDAAGGLMEIEIDEGLTGTCSVLSHSDNTEGVVEEGLAYTLENAHLTNRTALGVSNELIGTPARIALKSGALWIFLPLEALKHVSYAGVKLL